jgi:hypothetical protein
MNIETSYHNITTQLAFGGRAQGNSNNGTTIITLFGRQWRLPPRHTQTDVTRDHIRSSSSAAPPHYAFTTTRFLLLMAGNLHGRRDGIGIDRHDGMRRNFFPLPIPSYPQIARSPIPLH